jgi:lipoprotein NlpI
MMKVYAMYKGTASETDVLSAAKAGSPQPHQLQNRLFYAHLYIGLYHEALGKAEEARKHIDLSVNKYPSDHYMGDVARVHLDIMKKRDKKKTESTADAPPK